MKVAFVIQRYGLEVIGGAETLAREIAEKLVNQLGWEVDVYTSKAKDYMTWANEYDAAQTVINGVRVFRFRSLMGRSKFFWIYNRYTEMAVKYLDKTGDRPLLRRWLEYFWFILQGPWCPGLVSAVNRNQKQYQRIFFVTYLYYPTVFGARKLSEKAVLLPLAHDEPAFHFARVRALLNSCKRMILNTPAELCLVKEKLQGPESHKLYIAGVGFDPKHYRMRERDTTKRPDIAKILYLGRVSSGKGVQKLIDWFVQMNQDGKMLLQLAGKKEDNIVIPAGHAIEYLGFLSEADKVRVMSEATVLVNPSAHESLSMIVVEALALGVPVIVNMECEVLRYYTEQTDTAFGFSDPGSFEMRLLQVLQTDWSSDANWQKLQASSAWALDRFSWERVLAVYEKNVVA